MGQTMALSLKIWRQASQNVKGHFETYELDQVSTDMSFLEMFDVLNERLTKEGKDLVAFDHDCREGICGMCGAMVNGQAHGPLDETTLCQLHMRHFNDGDLLVIEPWRVKGFPIIKDLAVDRSSLDRVISAGGYTSASTGGVPEANDILISKNDADLAMDVAACIGCGACAAACPNASPMLFVGAKVSQMALLPQGQVDRSARVKQMVEQMDQEGFGNCSNTYECEAACPKAISVDSIARMNREYLLR